jgi:hypothetical protein
MLIPTYWAEARLQHRERKRTITLRRFGWSDIGDAEAQAHADARVREAMDRVLAGETLPRRERRVAYNGAEGVPIREEVVDRHGDSVITRNAYGALCLNTPNVLFADMDAPQLHPKLWQGCLPPLVVVGIIVLVCAAFVPMSLGMGTALWLIGALLSAMMFEKTIDRLWFAPRRARAMQAWEPQAKARVAAFLETRPDWSVRLYRTPAGLRLLAMHRTFDPHDSEVGVCFEALGADQLYARMCLNQNCFRARVSPKPWRMGLQRLRPPYSAAWRPEHAALPERRAWIERYDREAQSYSACRYLETLGDGATDADAESVRALHDLLCQAERDLPLA